MSIINSAIGHNARHSQVKAEIMMRRNDPYNNSMAREIHQDWYFTPVNTPPQQLNTNSAQPKLGENGRRISSLRKSLPHYLTSSGSVLSASLELNDNMVCCVPGHKSKATKQNDNSLLLTDMEGQESSKVDYPGHKSKATKQNVNSLLLTNTEGQESSKVDCKTDHVMDHVMRSTSYESKVNPHWQPLTTAALLEHTRVSEISVKGPGHKLHGHYPMWKTVTK